MKTTRRIQPWRRLVRGVHVAVVLGLPFVTVGGQSALRFDVPSLTLHFFGTQIGMEEFFIVLIVLLLLTFLVASFTILLGRIWCGWLCPQTVVSDLTRSVDRSRKKGNARRAAAYLWVLMVSPVIAADIIWYFVSPYEFIPRLFAGRLGPVIGWSWAALTGVTFLNFAFLRQGFCATVCPYAKMQGALYDERTLVIAADTDRRDECMRCDACVLTCPVGIDVRKGLNAACINCAECIDACADRMARQGRPSLIGYRFGNAAAGPLLRRPVVLTGAVTAVLFLLLSVLLMTRQAVEVDVSADPSHAAFREAGGRVISPFVLSLTNRTQDELFLQLRAESGGRQLPIAPNSASLARGEHRRMTIRVVWDEGDGRLAAPETVVITAVAKGMTTGQVRIERKALIAPPWKEQKP